MENTTKNKATIKKNKDKSKEINPKKGFSFKKYIITFWCIFFSFIALIVIIILLTINNFFGEMPNIRDLENPDIFIASEIISSDGVVLDRFEKEKRIPVKFKDLPQNLEYALMAKEDERFREHSGLDKKALFRAIVFLGKRGGGSTITQQLAKLLFTQKPVEDGLGNKIIRRKKFSRPFQKIKEIIIAVQLESLYTKNEIMTMYLNKFDFLNNANGIQTAAKIYLNKDIKDLSLEESAMFVAMLENPYFNNPKRFPEHCIKRRNLVLKLMLNQKYIQQDDYNKAINTPIKLNYTPISIINGGHSIYFKQELKKEVINVLSDYEKQTGKKYNLYKDGLKIYVTIDSRMQEYAEDAIKKHLIFLQRQFFNEQKGRKYAPFYRYKGDPSYEKIFTRSIISAMKNTPRYNTLKNSGLSDQEIIAKFKTPIKLELFTWKGNKDTLMSPWDSIIYHKHFVQSGLMSIEPTSGNIKAWVGGIDWSHFKYDHVKQAKRQVGSTFKPIIYLTAIRTLGYTPCTTISNENFSIGKWTIKQSGEWVNPTLRTALAQSLNPVSVRLISKTGVDAAIKTARDLGIESPIKKDLTIALGSADLSVYEMVGAYSTFANSGNYIKPEMLWRIEDKNGKIIKEFKPEVRESITEMNAYTMIDLMKGVVDNGTGRRLRSDFGFTGEIAGKTGTTNKNADGWFIGITPNLATGIWVGWEDRYAHFESTSIGQGARMAMPIWGYFMQKIYENSKIDITEQDRFSKPANINIDNCDDNITPENLPNNNNDPKKPIENIEEESVDTPSDKTYINERENEYNFNN